MYKLEDLIDPHVCSFAAGLNFRGKFLWSKHPLAFRNTFQSIHVEEQRIIFLSVLARLSCFKTLNFSRERVLSRAAIRQKEGEGE
jgi:hypothetical protein